MNRLACRLIGLGLWLAQPSKRRSDWATLDTLALGRWAVIQLNESYQSKELARRHAKPSTRRRVG